MYNLKTKPMNANCYMIESGSGQAYVITSNSGCTIVKVFFDGQYGIDRYDFPFKKQDGDIVTEIPRETFKQHFNKAVDQLHKTIEL